MPSHSAPPRRRSAARACAVAVAVALAPLALDAPDPANAQTTHEPASDALLTTPFTEIEPDLSTAPDGEPGDITPPEPDDATPPSPEPVPDDVVPPGEPAFEPAPFDPPPPATYSYSFRGDYDTGTLSQWAGVNRVATDRVRVLSSPRRQGRYAARFEVRRGDRPSSSGERAEVYRNPNGQERGGESYYYSFSMYLPSNWLQEQDGFRIPIQWHSVNKELGGRSPSPPLAFNFLPRSGRPNGTGKGGLYVDMKGGNLSTGSVTSSRAQILPLPIRTGVWHDFVVYVYWDRSKGDLKVWHKTPGSRFTVRSQIVDRPNLYFITSPSYSLSSVYVRQGLFRRERMTSATNVIHHDAYTVSKSYAAAAAVLP